MQMKINLNTKSQFKKRNSVKINADMLVPNVQFNKLLLRI